MGSNSTFYFATVPYVYLYSVTPAFENDYKELFQSEIKEKTLYQISEDGDSVILKKV